VYDIIYHTTAFRKLYRLQAHCERFKFACFIR